MIVIRSARLLAPVRRLFLCAALCIALILAAGCGGLGGEPLIVATLPPATAAPPEGNEPQSPPDLGAGAQIFAQHCTRCHGVDGQGQGELVLSGEVTAPKSLLDPETARNQTPIEWFTTISNGRLEKLMPPWRNELSEAERWNVALYTYTMHYRAEQIARGREIWEAECTDCHGPQGRGDGPEAGNVNGDVGDLTDQQEMTIVSDRVIYNFTAEGSAQDMPAFADRLSEEDIWAAAAYARTLSLQNVEIIGQAPPPAATEDPNAAAESAVAAISGQIANGTAGGSVPEALPLTLVVINNDFTRQNYETTSSADGRYRFENITLQADQVYAVTTTYRDRTFASDIRRGLESLDDELPLTIYELTEDTGVLTITRMVYQIDAVGEGLQIAQAMILRNESDRMFTSNRVVGDGQFASVVITLPPGAAFVGSDNPRRYVVSEDQTIIDTAPIVPGEDQIVQVVYFVPYSDSAIIEQPINYALSGPVRLLLRPDTVRVVSEQFLAIGPQTIGESSYAGYGADLTLNQGEALRFELSGSGAPTSAQLEPNVVSSSNLPLVIIAVLIGQAVLIGGLYLFYRRRGRSVQAADGPVEKNRLIDALARQIAELDETHNRGEINHDLYHHQRKQLKARLTELMEEKEERDETR